MSLRILADHCVPTSIVRSLQEMGHDILILRECIPQDSDDAAVIVAAQKHDAILLSLNGDFADITTYPPSRYRGIMALQIRNHPEVIPAMMRRFADYLKAHPRMAEYEGLLLLVEVHRIRIRR